MRKSLRLYFFISLLCGFSNLAYANVEINVYGGMNIRKGLCIGMDNDIGGNQYGGNQYGGNNNCNSNYNNGYSSYQDPSYSDNYIAPQRLGQKRPLIIGGDIIYRAPTTKGLGIGIRYQYMHSSEQQNVLFFNLNPKLTAHRISFLVNYRHMLTKNRNDGPFIGAILSLDIFRHAIISLQAGLSTAAFSPQQLQEQQDGGINIQIGDDPNNYPPAGLNMGTEFKASNWIGTGQLALEAGFKLASGILIRFEAGYSLYSFHDIETSMYAGGYDSRGVNQQSQDGINIDINSRDPYRSGGYGIPIPNMKANLSSFYIIFGIGFEAS